MPLLSPPSSSETHPGSPAGSGTDKPDPAQFVEEVVARFGRHQGAVIPILQALQDEYGYLPGEALLRVCELTDITPATVSGVSTFYDMFRHRPAGKFTVRVCTGTACHVTGAERVEDALRLRLNIPPGEDTDAGRMFTIERVACLGCCTLAPVVKIDGETYGHVGADRAPEVVDDFLHHKSKPHHTRSTEELPAAADPTPEKGEIRVGLGSCCIAKSSDELFHALEDSVTALRANAEVKRVGCVGMCHRTPMIEVCVPGKESVHYAELDATQARELVERHFPRPGWPQRVSRFVGSVLDALRFDDEDGDRSDVGAFAMNVARPEVRAFLESQTHIATEHFGKIDPLNIAEYQRHGGFEALRKCVESLRPEEIIDRIERSGLRGRGGAGFSTGAKWRLAQRQPGEVKFVICNGDEGDPGAFMDRMLLESFPFRIIEGLAIAALATGAREGFLYIRHEYPLAVRRVRAAIEMMEQRGWLGKSLLGIGPPFRLSIAEGAGAFVCGEETALIASMEGRRGMPELRPPYPVECGYQDKPTIINNVETLSMVPWIIRNGPEKFAAIGTATSKGTKVFALAGRVRRGGLIEIPMGTTIREIVEEIGGGADQGQVKAVQIGGPSGGCLPAHLFDTPVDFESLRDAGAIMGSGGIVVLDSSTCMVDIARYFLRFTQAQSCGKCTFCRVGTRRMLETLDRICEGKGTRKDVDNLEFLAQQVGAGSLCGLGKTAPNPVLTTLRYFREEYEAHLEGRCPAGKCTGLIRYQVQTNCTGCTLCSQHCPVHAIPFRPYQRHHVDDALCTRCDTCRVICPEQAIAIVTGKEGTVVGPSRSELQPTLVRA